MRSQKLSQPSSVLIFCFSTIPRLLSRLSSYQAGLRILGTEMVFRCVHRLVLDLPISTHSGLGYTIFDSVLVSIINLLSFYIRACHYNGILIYFSVLSAFTRAFCDVKLFEWPLLPFRCLFSSASRFGWISWIFHQTEAVKIGNRQEISMLFNPMPKLFSRSRTEFCGLWSNFVPCQ